MRSFSPKKPLAGGRESRRTPPPLDASRLDAMALAYVARFATSGAKLEAYLLRKLMQRGWAGAQDDGTDPEDGGAGLDASLMRELVAALVIRFVAAGYVDDRAFARTRSGGLQRRGYGKRHIAQALGQAGIAADDAAPALPNEAAARAATLALARRRRLGPYGAGGLDRAAREKQIGALLRAGHPLDSARELVNAPSIEAAEAWAREMDSEEG
jgi:regulatory protein